MMVSIVKQVSIFFTIFKYSKMYVYWTSNKLIVYTGYQFYYSNKLQAQNCGMFKPVNGPTHPFHYCMVCGGTSSFH